jgi:amidase
MPTHSAWVVRRLESLGGLVMGKTVTTEFAFRQPGKTRNPWNTAHTPGGSSSGSAAAVASGFVPVAIGTQTLGSVIRPAAFCGVVGYKPSYGAISRTGVHPFSATLDTVGVFARSVADAAWFGACLMGTDNRDDATLVKGPSKLLRVPLEPLGGAPRIAAVRTSKWPHASDAQKANYEQSVQRLADAGATIREVNLPRLFDDAWDNVMTIMSRDAVKSFFAIESRHRIRLSPPLIELLDRGHRVTPEQYAKARAKREEYRRWLDAGGAARRDRPLRLRAAQAPARLPGRRPLPRRRTRAADRRVDRSHARIQSGARWSGGRGAAGAGANQRPGLRRAAVALTTSRSSTQ